MNSSTQRTEIGKVRGSLYGEQWCTVAKEVLSKGTSMISQIYTGYVDQQANERPGLKENL